MLVTPPDVEQPQVQDTIPKLQDVVVVARPNLSNGEILEFEEVLKEFEGIFAMDSDDYRWTKRVYHRIRSRYERGLTDSPTPWQNKRMWVKCSRTSNDVRLSKSDSPW
jgi:hypothetical protein